MGRDLLVEMKAGGLSHTDMLFATHDVAPIPLVPGHEVAGIVAEVGPDVMQFDVPDLSAGQIRVKVRR
jgi:S-(hydroxymethyl)glutathione dehydrogenase / alcohol dehydrogenase